METLKKVLKWIGIALGIVLGIVVLIIVLMIIFPGFKLFGYRFVAHKPTESPSQSYTIDTTLEYYIIANTFSFDINVIENKTEDTILFSYINTKWGFAKNINTELSIKINEEDNIIEARMLEATGLVTGEGTLTISIPESFSCHLNLNTKDGDISINKKHNLSITSTLNDGTLTWSAEKFEYVIKDEYTKLKNHIIELIKQEELQNQEPVAPNNEEDENTGSGSNVGEDNTGEGSNNPSDGDNTGEETPPEEEEEQFVTLESISFEELYYAIKNNLVKEEIIKKDKDADKDTPDTIKITIPQDTISIGSFNTICNNASIKFTTLKNILIENNIKIKANYLTFSLNGLTTTNLKLECDKLNLDIPNLTCEEKLEILTNSGQINIGKLLSNDTATIITNRANVIINENDSVAHINTQSGSITITKTNKTLVLTTNTGNINTLNCISDIIATTNTGNINIDKYYSNAKIITKTGNIVVNNMGEEDGSLHTDIYQESGNITVTSENNEINITSQKGSNITTTIKNMCENRQINHNINNLYGTTNVYIKVADKPFKIRAVGKVQGELGSSIIITSNDNYTFYIPNGYQDNPIDISSINCDGGTVIFRGIYE